MDTGFWDEAHTFRPTSLPNSVSPLGTALDPCPHRQMKRARYSSKDPAPMPPILSRGGVGGGTSFQSVDKAIRSTLFPFKEKALSLGQTQGRG